VKRDCPGRIIMELPAADAMPGYGVTEGLVDRLAK
jgi:hypothetical protein